MPAKVKVKIVAGRNLPVMDRASDLTDAFVEIRFCNATHKTDVYRKSLNPQWNSEWFKFEVDDEDLQDEPLQIRVLDYDTYSSHDSIGKVYIDLNPLLWQDGPPSISGWFPIYDTMHGIRGDINLIVKVDLFTDVNRYRQSSCGVYFFGTAGCPEVYHLSAIYGFVEELVVNDDPEYKWIDKIRTPRASNEARQRLFSKLSGELRRKIGLKVLEMGGNAILGYQQCFDLEGESGIVVRGIGTVVALAKKDGDAPVSPHSVSPIRDCPLPEDSVLSSNLTSDNQSSGKPAMAIKTFTSPTKAGVPAPMLRRSSDSDISVSVSSSGSGGGPGGGTKPTIPKPAIQPQHIDIMEFPFFTLTTFPEGFLIHLCGVVTSRSVKLLDKIHNPDEPETRDAWWSEIRTEIRSHARAMGCNSVIGYSEQTSICDEIIILSAMGTGAVINLGGESGPSFDVCTMSLDRQTFERERDKLNKLHIDTTLANQLHRENLDTMKSCSMCHVPYNENTAPFPVTLSKCALCRKQRVPDVLFTTVEPPSKLRTIGKGSFLQARICRFKKEAKSESNAKEISDNLPFMEYELHKQLMCKLKLRGMNALFGLHVQIVVGETLLLAIAGATAVYIEAMPSPHLPKLIGKELSCSRNLSQKKILDLIHKNKELYDLYITDTNYMGSSSNPETPNTGLSTNNDSDEEMTDLDLVTGNKESFILEIDEEDDEGLNSVLMDSQPPKGISVCNTNCMPGLDNVVSNIQMFTRVWRGELMSNNCKEVSKICDNILKSLFFKLRHMIPCVLMRLHFDVEIPDDDIVQITCNGICMELGQANEKGFAEHDHENSAKQLSGSKLKTKNEVSIPSDETSIDISPLPYIAGAQIDKYLGNLNIFCIRESTSIREDGGLSGFMHSFVSEMLAVVRSHVQSLGGNALLSYKMTECILLDNPHKNQGQCLLNVCGDVVQATYGS